MTNVLVIGFGNMGRNHKRVLEQLGHNVKTLDPADVGADYRMITFDAILWTEFVCVAVPIGLLAQTAEAWLKRGKHVLVEKPGATDVATLAYLHQLAIEQKVNFAVGYTERHNGAVTALADALPQIGTLRHISMRRLGYADAAVDPALNLACHDLDVLDGLGLDPSVTNVERHDDHVVAHLVDDNFDQHHVEHLGDGIVDELHVFGSTVTVSIEASHLHPDKVRKLEAVGSDGVLEVDYQCRRLSIVKDGGVGLHGGDIAADDTEPLIAEWRTFLATGDGSNGIKALALAEVLADATAGTDAKRGGLGWSTAPTCTAQ